MITSRRGGPVPLRWKLLLSHLGTAVAAIGVQAIVVHLLADRATERHIGEMSRALGRPLGDELHLAIDRGVEFATLLALLVSVVLAVAAGVVAAGWIRHPLSRIAASAQNVSGGRYSARVEYRAEDEIGQLSLAFNEMAATLEQADRRRTELLATIAHELRTPLTTIQGYMEGLLDGFLPAEPETYEVVRREAERMAKLLQDIQGLARLDAGAERFNPRDVDLNAAVASAVKYVSPQFRERGVDLSYESMEDAARVWVDPEKLRQVLLNLLANARQYTPEGGRVRVLAEGDGARVRLSVSDNGIGIPEADLPHIFERFYRVDKSRSHRGGGAGIGLAVAKSIIERSGGVISAESRAGEGTTVCFVLPRAAGASDTD